MINFLSEEKDKNNNLLRIKHSDSMKIPKLLAFFLRSSAELLEKDMSVAYDLTLNKLKVIYAEIDDKIVGQIVYTCLDEIDKKTLFIVLSSVDKNYRQCGIYKILHKHFENTAKNMNCNFISSVIWKKNVVRLESIKSFDISLEPAFKLYGKRLYDQ